MDKNCSDGLKNLNRQSIFAIILRVCGVNLTCFMLGIYIFQWWNPKMVGGPRGYFGLKANTAFPRTSPKSGSRRPSKDVETVNNTTPIIGVSRLSMAHVMFTMPSMS